VAAESVVAVILGSDGDVLLLLLLLLMFMVL
jgi:hypothetical protein